MRFRTATAARLASLAALVLVFPEPASAGIDAASYQHVDVIREYPGPLGGDAGGFISCPAGTKAVASGATTSGLHDQLGAGLTTFDGNGAFVIAHGSSSGRLQISARCVEAAQVQPATLATNRIRDHRPGYYHTGTASCPPGTVAYGGGGFFSQPGGQPFGGSSVYASMPVAGGTGWFFAATASVSSDTEMWVSAHCLPRAQFGEIVTVFQTDTAPPGFPRDDPNYPTLSATARCPFGFAYAGGAWLHRPGPSSSTAESVGHLTVSNMTADDRGWFAQGWVFAEGAELTVTVQCMTLRID
jgi:hypothetical protein